MRRVARCLVVMVMVAAGMVGCGSAGRSAAPSASTSAPQRPIYGVVLNAESGCAGYTEVPAHGTVVVSDETGKAIDTATLAPFMDAYPRDSYSRGVCALTFKASVPPATIYRFEVGGFSWSMSATAVDRNAGHVTLPIEIAAGQPRAGGAT